MAGIRRWRMAQRAERRWWRRYLREREPGEYLAVKTAQWQREIALIGEALTVPAGARLLDAGCGPAGIFMMFPACSVDAVDPLIKAYETDLPHFSRQAWPWVTFHPVPFEEYAVESVYDVVFCNNAVNHFSEQVGESIERLLGALAPGGRLVLSSDAHNHALFRYLFRAVPFDILHPHQYAAGEYEAMITGCGGVIEKRVVVKESFFFDRWLWVVRSGD